MNWDKIKKNKKQFTLIFLIIAAVLGSGYGILNYIPLDIFTIQAKPQQSPQKIYDYYIIVDKDTGIHLMYVPLIVTVGDQLISEDNKQYIVVEIKDNIAYAKIVKKQLR